MFREPEIGRICCVPMCPSKSGTRGINFHEIPSTAAGRQAWLKVISRADSANPNKNWQPGSRSAVCSRHFLETDYILNHKQKRLKTDAVPSVFPEYPQHKLPSLKPKRKSPLVRNQESPPKKRKLESFATHSSQHPEFMEIDTCSSLNETSESNPRNTNQALDSQRLIKQLRAKIKALRCAARRKNKTILSLNSQLSNFEKSSTLSPSLGKIQSDADKGEIKALLLIQQIQAYGKARFKWSELCIRMCILWRSKSPRAYNFARTQCINLPCRSTLQKYIGPSSLETGFTHLARVRLQEEFQNLTDEAKLCSLIMDEMTFLPKLQFKKQADKIVGKAEYGRNAASGALANRLLCFVLKGLSTNYRIPVAYYLTCQLQGADLSKLIVEVITEVEDIGFKLCPLVSDDATTNVKAYETLCGGPLTHVITHPVRPDDPLFLSFDQCHIIKNIRNQFLDDNRQLNKDGRSISSKPIKTLYENQKYLPIKPVRFLTRKMLYPTSFEKMNVRRAIQLFSSEVIASLEFCNFKNLAGFRTIGATIEFMKIVQKWFNIHNVCNTTHYIMSRDDDKRHFGMIDDQRLTWLENDFLDYFASWEHYARSFKQPKGKSKTKIFLTRETYTAIKITTISTVECIRYLIRSGFHFVLTRKFSSDDVEGIFSAVRASHGHNDQANAVSCLYALETILKTGLFSSSIYGNCSDQTNESVHEAFQRKNVLGRIMPPGVIIELNTGQKILAAKLADPPDVPNVTTKAAGVAMVAGFLLRLLKDKHPCSEAGCNLVGDSNDPINKLISLQDRGGLMYPSHTFVCFVKLIFDILSLSTNHCETNALVKSWKITFKAILPSNSLVCPCGDTDHTDQIRDMVMGSLCKIYFNNICFNLTNESNEKPKFCNKPCSKKIKKL